MRGVRLALKIVGLLALSVVGTVAVVFAGLQTRLGKDWLVGALNHAMAGTAQISGLAGDIPWDMSIARIQLLDAGGPWGEIDDVVWKLRLADLLGGRLTIADLRADRVSVERKPQPSPPGATPPRPTRLPIAVDLQHLEILTVELAAPVVGRAMTMALTGDAAFSDGERRARVTLARIDGQPGRIDAALVLSGVPSRLQVDIRADEPTGQLLNRLLSRDDNLPLAVDFHGAGPLADWHGHLEVDAGAIGRLTTAIALSDQGGYHAALDGRAAAEGLLPPSIASAIGNDAAFHVVAGEKPNGDIWIQALHLGLAAADIDGSGQAGTGADGPVAAELRIAAADLGAFSTLLRQPAAGAATISLTATGTRGTPSLRATVDGHGLRLAQRGMESLSAQVTAEPSGPLGQPQTAIAVGGEGQFSGITLEGAPALTPNLSWRVAGSSSADGRKITIKQLAVENPGLTLTVKGTTDRDTQTLSAAFHLDAADLSTLAAVVGRPVAGHAQLDGTLSGPIRRPNLDARLSAKGVASGELRFDTLAARLQTVGAPNLAGTAEAEFRSGRLAGRLDGRAALSADGKTLDLPRLHFAADGTTLDAALRTALDTHLTRGRIEAHSADLSPLSGLLGMPLSGRIDVDATLADERGQTLAVALSARQLGLSSTSGGPATIDRMTANGRFADLLGKATGNGDLAILGAKVGGASLERLDTSVTSRRPGDFVFRTGLRGQFKVPIGMAATGNAAVAPNAITARVVTLDGNLGDQRLHLDRPLRLAKSGAALSFADLGLNFGAGRISGTGSLTPQSVLARLEARNLPLAPAEAFLGQGAIGGALDANVDVRGPVERPAGRIALNARGLRFASARRATLPPIAVGADMRLSPGRIELTGRVSGPKGQAVDLSGTLPVAFSGHPFSASVPRNAPLSLRIRGDGKIEDVADLLPIGQDRLSGHYHLDLSASGSLAAPVASGRMSVDNGHYESLEFGTVLDAITAEIAGDRDRIVLRQLTANDGDKGTVSLGGTVLPAAPGGPTLDATLALHHFRLIHTDDAVSHGSGEIHVTGSAIQPQIMARLSVDDGQLYLAERLPPNVRALPVTVINSKTGQVLRTPPPPARHPPMVAALDVTVNIPGPVFVRGRGLDSQWQGHFTVGGTSKEPDIHGSLQVIQGTMNFLGKTLDLTRGSITLVGDGKIEPLVDLVAQSSTAQIQAQVEVTGSAEHPTIKLTSQPPLPQDQILSQLLFGSDMSQLSPLEAAQIAEAAAELTSGGPGVIDRIRMKFGLDRLSIGSSQQNLPGMPATPSTSSSSSSGAAGAVGSTTVSAGKYVAPGVYVGVDQGVSGESRVDVQVELSRHLTVDGTESAQEGPGAGLAWKLDY